MIFKEILWRKVLFFRIFAKESMIFFKFLWREVWFLKEFWRKVWFFRISLKESMIFLEFLWGKIWFWKFAPGHCSFPVWLGLPRSFHHFLFSSFSRSQNLANPLKVVIFEVSKLFKCCFLRSQNLLNSFSRSTKWKVSEKSLFLRSQNLVSFPFQGLKISLVLIFEVSKSVKSVYFQGLKIVKFLFLRSQNLLNFHFWGLQNGKSRKSLHFRGLKIS